jgi:hypothetical protein
MLAGSSLSVFGFEVLFVDRGAANGFRPGEQSLVGEGEGDVLSRHLVTIVEFHALAELELDGLVVEPLPFGGELGDRTLVSHPVAADQALPEIRIEYAFADIRLLVPVVQGVVVADLLHRDGDRAACALRHQAARQNEGAGSGTHESQGLTTIK